MSNDITAPNVSNNGETNVPTNLAQQSGLPNMTSTKIFTVQTDMIVEGDVYATNYFGPGGAPISTYAVKVGYNPSDPSDLTSLVLDAGTDGTDSQLTITNITADGTVDFTGATLVGIPDLVGISLTDLSVSVNAVGVANLEYDNTTGVFTYTPPDLSSYLTASSTDTLTNKSGSNSQWTNDEGFTTNTGTVTPSSTDTFTNKSGSNSQWTNDEGFTTNTGTVTPSSTDVFTNKSGSNSQWTNDEGFTTNTGTTTADNVQTFTNKSGSNSQWTNDEGFTTNVGDITEVVAGTSLSGGATSGSATLDVANDGITATQLSVTGNGNAGQVLSSDGDGTFTWIASGAGGGIDLTDLSVTVAAVGTANLAYNDLTGVFTYTPPDLTTYLTESSTSTLTNKSGSNSQWTNDEGFTTNTGTVTPSSTDVFTNKSGSNSQWTNDEGFTTNVGDITEVVAGTGLTGGATSGSATLDIDSTVATLTGAQTLTNKALTSAALTTPTIVGGTSDWQFSVSGDDLIISYGGVSKAKLTTTGDLVVAGNLTAYGTI